MRITTKRVLITITCVCFIFFFFMITTNIFYKLHYANQMVKKAEEHYSINTEGLYFLIDAKYRIGGIYYNKKLINDNFYLTKEEINTLAKEKNISYIIINSKE